MKLARRPLLLSAAAALAHRAAFAVPLSHTIDTHTHFYDPTRPGGVPWPSKDDALLYRPTLPADWEAVARPTGATGTIAVECSPLVEDNQWLLDLADRHAEGLPPGLGIVGVVGRLPLGEPGCAAIIDRFAKQRRFVGVRVNGDALRRGLADTAFQRDVSQLADHGLALDVNHGAALEAAAEAAAHWPGLRIIVDHLGGPAIGPRGPQAEWRARLAAIAPHESVFMKVSGLPETAAGAPDRPRNLTDPAIYEPWLEAAWAACGPRRLMFGSNWPVSNRGVPYADVVAIVAPFVRSRGAEAERWFFDGASRAAYRWDSR